MVESPNSNEATKALAAISTVRRLIASGEARAIRHAAGATQASIAGVVGCTASAVSHWEAAERFPTGETALRYADALAECLRLAEESA